ncbi:MAG: formate-dependent phosphoribosylglycinamide formyltransferase [Corynebacterium sp.]|uniref:formate-dependent phosphoribosylglycinamide formyltransferase n=1 Tax=Corynebacterium sp. TaxID=1720 RepID=UPI0026DB3B82|nr:formate-dependent phosphoribosylglycinamide formyltransferase [Corynebacterium sp.]MDO5097440.1 formate-dependent phosphoribosylglycinamide formyltransferase [Corynebacterium sp.]
MFTPKTVGTPLSPNAIRVMLLGSGELGKEIAIAFQRLGVEVHAVDRYENAPAHQVSHFGYTVDMTDGAAIKELVDFVDPHFIVPELEALNTRTLVQLEEEGRTVVPTAKATQLTMNREGIRRLASEKLGIPTSAYWFASTEAEFQEAVANAGFPCVAKPSMSSSGKGQSVLQGPEDIPRAWRTAQRDGRNPSSTVMVERFVNFDFEITLLTIRSIDPQSGELATWFCEPIGHRQLGGDYVESWQPMPLSPTALDAARSIAARITNALGGRGVFGVELFIAGDEVYFSEVSPRPHDTGMVTLATQRFDQFALHARAILGLPIDVTCTSPGASAVIYGGVDAPAVGYTGLAQALAIPESDIRLFGKPESFAYRRMGVALSTAEDVTTAKARAKAAAGSIQVVAN